MKGLKFCLCCLILGFVSGCSNHNQQVLNVMFAPTKNADSILSGTKPMAEILKTQLNNRGYNFSQVNLTVGESYEVVGEALSSGTVDIAYIPAGTYIKYQPQGVKALLTAQHPGVSINSNDPVVWNEHKPTTITDEKASTYQAIIVSGITPLAQQLAQKVNQHEPLSFDELNRANWCVSSPTSSSGYLYPSLWLKDNYQHTIKDLANQVRITGYGESVNNLRSGVCDISVGYGDFRYDYQQDWPTIWDETNVLGVSTMIPYDTISVSEHSQVMNAKLEQDLIEIYQQLPSIPGGSEAMKTFNHVGYVKPNLAQYEVEKRVMEEIEGI